MTSTPINLRPLKLIPEEFQSWAWHGVSLQLPPEWSLRFHHGTGRRGAIVFGDLREIRLEVRWLTPWWGSPTRHVEKIAAKIRRRHGADKVKMIGAGAFEIKHGERITILACDDERVYEMHWGDKPPEEAEAITDDFLRRVHIFGEGPMYRLWAAYGISAWVPAQARLLEASLLPGASTLRFKHRGKMMVHGVVSMAERLLARTGGLREWAKELPVVRSHPEGAWSGELEYTGLFRATGRGPFGRDHHVIVTYLPRRNQIIWSHIASARGKRLDA